MEIVTYSPTDQIVVPPKRRFLGVGIAPLSDVGVVTGQAAIIGVGSPLLLGEKIDHIQFQRATAYPGFVHLAYATSQDDLAALARPRPPRYKLFSGTAAAAVDTTLTVPFNGRERCYAVFTYSGAGTPAGSIATRLRHYYDSTNYDEDPLNTYTQATLVETTPAGFEETERGDEMAFVIQYDVAVTYRLHVWTHDAGT